MPLSSPVRKEASRRIEILLLEDNRNDAALLEANLEGAGLTCDVVCVETESGFRKALERSLDLIISDYSLPSFDGKTALRIARESRPDVPFIFVSGTLGEEAAVDSLLSGATDYVLKDKFARLIPAVQRALREAQDQRARREAEQALRQSEEKYRRLFEESPDTIFIASLDGTLMDINPAGVKLLGYSSKAQLLRSNIARDVYWDANRWIQTRSQLQYQQCIEDVEVELKRNDGTKLIVLETMTCLADESGAKTFRGTWRDVTKHRELEAQFLRAQRMESLGSLAGGIAHDLNNVLSPIVMGIQVLREKHGDPDTIHYQNVLETCAKRGASLLRQILTFARGVEAHRAPLDLKRLIGDVEKMLQQTFPRSIAIVTNLAPDLWPISAAKTQMEQVLMNLCVNARDAMPGGGTLSITARNEMLSTKTRNSTEMRQEPYVVIDVSDSGQGIAPDTLDKIFDPFFTTKEPGKGTGLGLSTVRTIVKSHAGFVHVDSTANHGTTFKVYLPVSVTGAPRAESATLSASAFPPGKGELVLVVDDEAAVRDLARTILENYNYRVLVAAGGVEARAIYSEHWREVQMVLTDLEMPEMSGPELIRELEQINPAVRVISASGLLVSDTVEPSAFGAVCAVLHKPFSPAELLGLLHHTLHL